MKKECVVCGAPLPTGYSGRPRVTCSPECYTIRRTIRAHNRQRLETASRHILRAVGDLTPWPELQLQLSKMAGVLASLGDEVTPQNMELDKNPR